MSDKAKAELIAAAQVNAFAGPPAGIEFESNVGFKTATRSSAGSYELELNDKPEKDELVVNVTPNNTAPVGIEASLPREGIIQISSSNTDGPVDSPFFITVYRIKS